MADHSNPTLPPHPDGGWSDSIVSLDQALVVPSESREMVQPSGVFDRDGRFVHEAVLWRRFALMTEPPVPPSAAELPGRWLWGGVLLNHFGHFLTESTGRLWALDALQGPIDGIVFIAKREESDEASHDIQLGLHKLFFALLGITLPVRILSVPTRIERLEVPGQGFGIGRMARGTAAFRAYMQKNFAKAVAPEGGENLYISRSGLGALRGGLIEETRIEAELAKSGYETFHPQNHSLEVQIARYKAARRVIAPDGSALHLFAMTARPDQDIAIIKRRDSNVSKGIVDHLAAFAGRDPAVIDVIRQDWVRSDRARADRFSLGELDMRALGQALKNHGFLGSAAEEWPDLPEADIRAALDAIEGRLRRAKLHFKPLPRNTANTAEAQLTRRERRRLQNAGT